MDGALFRRAEPKLISTRFGRTFNRALQVKCSWQMAAVEIRDYSGDFEDVAELARRVWAQEYAGRTWVATQDAAYLRSRITPESGALCLVAYHGTRLVGSIFSIPHSLRVGDRVFPIALYSGFTVDPEHRRMALPLVERLRRANDDRGIAFGIGMVLDVPHSSSYRFWMKYAQAFPQNFQIVFRGGHWGKFLEPRHLALGGLYAWERMAGRVLGPLLRFTPYGYDPHVRPYQPTDLEQCAQMLDKTSAQFDWALSWERHQLACQLNNPECRTFVFERDGQVKGVVNGHCFALQGRELMRGAMIDLWADDGLRETERVRLLSHLCTDLRARGVHALLACRSAMMPTTAFVGNLFIPGPEHFHVGVFLTPRTIPLSPPRTWSLEII